jgi:uncharacterized membrane protein
VGVTHLRFQLIVWTLVAAACALLVVIAYAVDGRLDFVIAAIPVVLAWLLVDRHFRRRYARP